MSQKIQCPDCQGPLKVWIEIDAEMSFHVSRTGKFSKREVRDNEQTDGRCGFNCQNCDWKIHVNDLEDEALLQVIKSANDQLQELELSLRARK